MGNAGASARRPEQHDRDAILLRLKATPLFGDLSPAELERLVAMGEVQALEPGALLIREGELADALFVVLAGELEVTKRSGNADVPLDRVGPGSLQGDIAALEGGRRLASVRALTPTEVLRIPVEALRELLTSGPGVAMAIIGTALRRLRTMEAALRGREKLAGLGTLAAGLAHELNNPAAAAVRTAAAIQDALARLERVSAATLAVRAPASAEPPLSALERADRIDELSAVVGDEAAAAALVGAGWTAQALDGQPTGAVAWLAADAEVHQLLDELRMAVERISAIVGAVKGYAYLDQAPVQRIDVRRGLEQTLIILRHRLEGGIEVRLDLPDGLPEIEAYGSELNQVWTNLIDNAIDAMAGRGVLEVRAERDPDADGVRIAICDSGPGIPDPVRARLFEPFFTTKPPGKGTGLGLHISHTVVATNGGRIDVASEPGRTCFVVTLPARLPRG